MNSTILVCSSSLVILTLLLAFWTSVQRGATNTIAYNAPSDPASSMAKVQRAHGNAAEYAGLLIGLFIIVDMTHEGGDLGAFLTGAVVLVTIARIVHAIGFLICASLDRIHPLKAIGALGTYVGGIALALSALIRALS